MLVNLIYSLPFPKDPDGLQQLKIKEPDCKNHTNTTTYTPLLNTDRRMLVQKEKFSIEN